MSLYLKQLLLGPMENFVYLVADEDTREAVVIDAAWDIGEILKVIEQDDLKLKAALVTHFHPDHLGGKLMGHQIQGAAELLARNIPVKVWIHKAEADYVQRISGLSRTDLMLTDGGEDLPVGNIPLRFLHTPGHTPGSQCFLVDGRVISGDTLFIGSCGRVDLPGSNPTDLYYSLNQKLKCLPDETILLPGHNYSPERTSSIGREKTNNPFMRFERVEDYLRAMGH